jgi:CTP-dependent riboflavin kinase
VSDSACPDLLRGRVQAGKGDAAHWLFLFNDAYARKTGMAIFPESLNVVLDMPFDWFAPRWQSFIVWFGSEDYGGERDILLLPCVLSSLRSQRAFLWSTTTAARAPKDQRLVEIIAPVGLRAALRPAGR